MLLRCAKKIQIFLAYAQILLRRSQRLNIIPDKFAVIMFLIVGTPPDRAAEKGMELSKSVKKEHRWASLSKQANNQSLIRSTFPAAARKRKNQKSNAWHYIHPRSSFHPDIFALLLTLV